MWDYYNPREVYLMVMEYRIGDNEMEYPRLVEIEVTQADINFGCPMENDNCPIAHAANRVLGKYGNISVTNTYIKVFDPLHSLSRLLPVVKYELPVQARQFINRFDKCEPVQPIKFTAERVDNAY